MCARAAWCVLAVLAVLLAGCGGEESSSPAATEVRLAVLPVADVAPVYLGIDRGFFKAEGLRVEAEILQNGAEVTAAVVSGDLNIGFSSLAPLPGPGAWTRSAPSSRS